MYIFPAVDIYGGKAVRLYKGDYGNMTVYSDNPAEKAMEFREAGAEFVHLVDLEGARDGGAVNFKTVSDIIRKSGLRAEIGGGIRSEDTVARYLDAGAMRVILGTAALEDPEFLRRMVSKYGDGISVGVDARDGLVSVRGWLKTSDVDCFAFIERLAEVGVRHIICTDISKDGAMSGTNRELYRELAGRFDIDITASGGISSLEDIAALRDMGLYGAILGKAIYTGEIDLRKAIGAAR